MNFTSYLQNGQLTVVLRGEIDHHSARNYIDAIAGKIETYSPRLCILDFTEVSFMDSSGIAVVINAMRNMTRLEGKLEISGLQEQPKRVFYASGIDQIVHVKEAIL